MFTVALISSFLTLWSTWLLTIEGTDELRYWTSSVSSSLPYVGRNAIVAYEKESDYPDCIFILGGNVDGGVNSLVHCYNITSGEVIYWDYLNTDSGGHYAHSTPAAVIISHNNENLIYYVTINGEIIKYDIDNKQSTKMKDLGSGTYYLCLNKQPTGYNSSNYELYLVDGYSRTNFYIYNLINNDLVSGSTLQASVYRPCCIVADYGTDNPYLYVLAGKTTKIQRISLNHVTLNTWELLTTELTVTDSGCDTDYSSDAAAYGVAYNNLIYIIGGYTYSGASSGPDTKCITSFDIVNEAVSYVGDFPKEISRFGMRSVLQGCFFYLLSNGLFSIDFFVCGRIF